MLIMFPLERFLFQSLPGTKERQSRVRLDLLLISAIGYHNFKCPERGEEGEYRAYATDKQRRCAGYIRRAIAIVFMNQIVKVVVPKAPCR